MKKILIIVALIGVTVGIQSATVTPTVQAKTGEWTLGKCYQRKPTLSRRTNRTHSCVYQLQFILKEGGYRPGPLDSIFGPKTEASVKRFQRDYNLVADGIVGPKTWRKLLYVFGFFD